ncbi:hypothetical protein [Paraherbaspirillum soli]|uniref:Lipoprotein n=1 Tax=Paraherbaspirillum soli TaxID=631222 RepID=A0ABW0M752_9BURK
MNLKITLATGLLALATVACSAETSVKQATNTPHKSAAKVGAPVTVELVSSGQTSKNAKLPLMLLFKTDQPNVPLHVEYRTDAGLSLITVGNAALVSNQDGVVTDTPNVRAAEDGVYQLNVFVTIGDRTRAVSIPVTVGNAKPVLKSAGKAIQTPKGENLTILPAQETSR